jgi:hypothetical protein
MDNNLSLTSSNLNYGVAVSGQKVTYICKGKVKFSLCLTNSAVRHEDVWVSGRIDSRFLDLGTSWRWEFRLTPRPLYPLGKRTGMHWIGGWLDPRADVYCVENRKWLILPGLELRPLGRPSRIQWLYRLSYTSMLYWYKIPAPHVIWLQPQFLAVMIISHEILEHAHKQLGTHFRSIWELHLLSSSLDGVFCSLHTKPHHRSVVLLIRNAPCLACVYLRK